MTSEELQWAVKSLIAGMIWTSGRNDTEADVWDEVDALFAERAARDEMLLTGSPITLTDDECEAIIDTVAGAWALHSHMRGPIRSAIAETLAVVNCLAVGLNRTPAPVGASSTAVDETQGETVADRITDAEIWGLIEVHGSKYDSSPNTYDSHMKDAIREAIRIDRSCRDAVPRFTAAEVAERLVSVSWGGIDRDGAEYWHPMIGGILWSRCLSESHAEEHAADFRATIIRTLEAKP